MLPSSNTVSSSSCSVTVTGQNSDPMVHPRVSVGLCATVAASLLMSSAHAVDVDGVITVDNAYGFADALNTSDPGKTPTQALPDRKDRFFLPRAASKNPKTLIPRTNTHHGVHA